MRSSRLLDGRPARSLAVLFIGATVALASACSSSNGGGAGGGGSTAPVKVGLVYSQTGLLASYGKEYRQGFDAGLQYATNGTGSAGGHKIEIIPRDDAGDSAKGVSATKDLIGQGVKMIAGTVDSGIATQLAPLAAQNQVLYISGPAATDAITGINKYTFRSGRESYQDVKTAAAVVGDVSGKSVLVFAQDYEFGQANAKAVQQVLGGAGAKVSSLLVPLSAKDFTPFAQQIKQKKPDLLFVAWAGDTTSAMWTALDQQGIFGIAKVITGLADSASFNAYGSATTKIQFLAHYFPGAADNPVNTKMISLVKQAGGTPDLFTPDGFVAAQMVVHAVKTANGDSVDKMISALDGWTFQAPKGEQTVRAGDHAMVQPMFIATLQKSGSSFEPKLVKSVPVNDVAPPSGS